MSSFAILKNQSLITKKWQGDFSHNWNILKTKDLLTKFEHLSLASSEDLIPSSSIDIPEKKIQIIILIIILISVETQLL